MKIAINAMPIGAGMTGIGTYAQSLLEAASQLAARHEFVIFAHASSEPTEIEHLTRVDVDAPGSMWEQVQLPDQLVARGIDLYHSPLFTCPVMGPTAKLVTVHDMIPEDHPELCTSRFLQFHGLHIGSALRAAHAIVVTSEHCRSRLLAHWDLPEDRVHVVHQAVGERFFRADTEGDPQDPLPLPDGVAYILAVGMIEPRKNLERLVRAFACIAPELSGVHLVLAGRRDDPAYDLSGLVRQCGIDGRVHFPGYVPADALPGLYRSARVLAFPSLAEGFGRPVVEAMACGVPVLAANVDAIPEVAGDTALLVPPDDETAIADGLQRLLTDMPFRERLIARGKARSRDFTPTAFSERLGKLYDSLEARLCG